MDKGVRGVNMGEFCWHVALKPSDQISLPYGVNGGYLLRHRLIITLGFKDVR
jgi:hypothetical protein